MSVWMSAEEEEADAASRIYVVCSTVFERCAVGHPGSTRGDTPALQTDLSRCFLAD